MAHIQLGNERSPTPYAFAPRFEEGDQPAAQTIRVFLSPQ